MIYCEIPEPSATLICAKNHVFYVCLSGSLILDVAFEKRTLTQGEVYYCSPLLGHFVCSHESFAGFQIIVTPGAWRSLGYLNFQFMKVTLSPVGRILAAELLGLGGDPSPRSSLLETVAFFTHVQMKKSCGWDEQAKPWFSHKIGGSKDSRVKKAALFLRNHCTEEVDFDDLAKKSGLSPRNMRRLFQESFGMGPVEALRSLRMEWALPLICSTNTSLDEIAYQCGYENPASISRDFRLTFSEAPGKYRKRNLKPM